MEYPKTFELPTTDHMTGLLDVAYFRHLLREELLPQAQNSGNPLSLFLLDLDGFALINEKYGHQCGSQILLAVAQTLQETLPPMARIVRYSGDEFGGALPDTRLDDAFTLVEELRRRILALKFDAWPEAKVSCGIGLAAYPGNGNNDVELIREADQALYIAKSTGSNKVALPLADSRMITKTSHYTQTQLERLSQLARTIRSNEASLLREALDDLLKKYNDRLGAPPAPAS